MLSKRLTVARKNLQLLMNSDTGGGTVQDLVHMINATLTGGVGGSFTEESNFQTILNRSFPVIAQAADNLLSDEDASFEDGTVGNWSGGLLTLSVESSNAWHGSKCLKATAQEAGAQSLVNNVTAITSAGTQYTYSGRIKGSSGAVGKRVYARHYDDIDGFDETLLITLTTDWQFFQIAGTFNAGSSDRRIYIRDVDDIPTDDYFLFDAIQLEAGAVATPFCHNSRTASTCKFPTADLGLTAGQDMSIVVVTKTPWAGDDGNQYYLASTVVVDNNDGWYLYKSTDNYLRIRTLYGALKTTSISLNGTNWAADTNHIVIATMDSSNNQQLYLDGSGPGTSAGTAVRETSINSNLFLGTDRNEANPVNAPIGVAILDRVLSGDEITLLSNMTQWPTRSMRIG